MEETHYQKVLLLIVSAQFRGHQTFSEDKLVKIYSKTLSAHRQYLQEVKVVFVRLPCLCDMFFGFFEVDLQAFIRQTQAS